jgi:hypothetical protein
MVAQLAVDGLSDSASLEAAVQRWITRLELAHHLTHCEVAIRIGSARFGFARRANIDLAVSNPAGEITVHRSERFDDETQLLFVISNAFRDAHHRLERGMSPTTGG